MHTVHAMEQCIRPQLIVSSSAALSIAGCHHIGHPSNPAIMSAPLPPRPPLSTLRNCVNNVRQRGGDIPAHTIIRYAFTLAKKQNTELLWKLFGCTLYPGCMQYPEIQQMIDFVAACPALVVAGVQKTIEHIVLGAYMQKNPTLYTHSLAIIEHGAEVISTIADANVSMIVTRLQDGTIELFNRKTGKVLQLLTEQSHVINSMALSPDGGMLAVSENNTVRIWDTSTALLVYSLIGGVKKITSCMFSPHGNTLAVCEQNSIHLWNSKTASLLHKLIGHVNRIRTIAFSSDGSMIASASSWHTTCIWDTTTGALLHTLPNGRGKVFCITFSLDGSLLATLASNNTINLWDIKTGTLLKTLTGSAGFLHAMDCNHSGSIIATVSTNHFAQRWDTKTGRAHSLQQVEALLEPFIVFSPDGSLLISKTRDAIFIWDSEKGALRNTFTTGHIAPIDVVQYSPDGSVIVSMSRRDSTIRFWGYQSLCEALLAPEQAPVAPSAI